MQPSIKQSAASGQQERSQKTGYLIGGIIMCGRYYIAEELKQIIDMINRK